MKKIGVWGVWVGMLLSIGVSASESPSTLFVDFNGSQALRANLEPQWPMTVVAAQATEEATLAAILGALGRHRYTTVVFSGHSDGMRFSGRLGAVRITDLAAEAPEGFASVERLVLRGCFTATLKSVLPSSPWFTLFPRLRFLVGHASRAWSSQTPEALAFMTLALGTDDTPTAAQIAEVFQASPEARRMELAFWKRPVGDEPDYLRPEGVEARLISVRALQAACAHRREARDAKATRFAQVQVHDFSAEQTAELRAIYAWFRHHEHCETVDQWSLTGWADPDRQVMAFYRRNVILNFRVFVPDGQLALHLSVVGPSYTEDSVAELYRTRTGQMRLLVALMDVDNHCTMNPSACAHLDYDPRLVTQAYDRIVVQHDPLLPLQWATDIEGVQWPLLIPKPFLPRPFGFMPDVMSAPPSALEAIEAPIVCCAFSTGHPGPRL